MFCKNGKTFALESLFNEKLHAKSCRTKTSLKETPTQVFSCKKLAKFLNTDFGEHLRTTASNIYPNKAALSTARLNYSFRQYCLLESLYQKLTSIYLFVCLNIVY